MQQINATFSGPSHGRHIGAPIGSSGTNERLGEGEGFDDHKTGRIRRLRAAAAAGIFVVSGPLVSGPEALAQADAASPIQHLIVVIEENHSFDNVYGTYTPGPGQSIDNLLSKGIVKADGSPGPNVALALQHTASDTVTYSLDPTLTGAYNPLPQPNTTSAIGQPPNVPDPRFPADLPNAPFQITKYTEYQNDYVGDPIHASTRCSSRWPRATTTSSCGTTRPKGAVSHSYTDHTSIAKFIERNWRLPALSSRSWDNLPNPKASAANPYVPTNGPAVGDLFDLFNFGNSGGS